MSLWWEILGYDSLDEANRDIANGSLSSSEVQRAKDEAYKASAETGGMSATEIQNLRSNEQAEYYANLYSGDDEEDSTAVVTEEDEEDGSPTLYLVVGQPPNYTVVAVEEGDDGYNSGMSQQAAQETATKLNAEYVPPSVSDDTVTTVDDAETADPNFFDVDARYNDEYQEPDLNMNSILEDIATRFPYFPTSVLNEYAMNYIDSGDDAVALRKTEASQVFKQAFPGIRREDGTMRYTVGEYLGVKEDMRVQVAEYGLNPEIFETQFNQLIEGDVAPAELARRLEQVQAQIGNNIPAVQQAFAAQFGVPLSAEAILAAVVSPEIEEGLLSGTITAAQVQGEAIAAGFQTSFARSQALARAGLTQQQAAETYQFGKTAMDLASRAGREFVLADVEEAAVGDAEAAKRVRAILAEVESQSLARAGARKSQTGAVTGLTEA